MSAHFEHRRTVAACTLLVFLMATGDVRTVYGADDKDGKRKLLTFIKESYEANLDAFHFCTCKFVHIKGVADSMESALKGQVKNPIIRDGIWTYNGQKIIYELKCRKPWNPKVTPPKLGTMGLECGGEAGFSNGSIVLSYTPEGSLANIWSPDNCNPKLNVDFTPFTVGIMGSNGESNPASWVEKALRGELEWDVPQFSADRKGSRVALVFGRIGAPKTYHIEINMEKGCLPEVMSDCYYQTTKRMYEMHTTDILQCSKDRWFPKRTVIVWDPDDKKPPIRVDILEVTKLDVDTPPPDSELVLHLPPGVQVFEPRGKDSGYVTKTSETILANDLDSVLQKCRSRAARIAMREHLHPIRGNIWILVSLFLLGILLFWFGYRMHKRRRMST